MLHDDTDGPFGNAAAEYVELTARFEGRGLPYGLGELDALVPAHATTVAERCTRRVARRVLGWTAKRRRCRSCACPALGRTQDELAYRRAF